MFKFDLKNNIFTLKIDEYEHQSDSDYAHSAPDFFEEALRKSVSRSENGSICSMSPSSKSDLGTPSNFLLNVSVLTRSRSVAHMTNK